MSLFVAVDDDLLAGRISGATRRIVFVGPAASKTVAEALGRTFHRAGEVSITIVIDLGEDAYRIGYGDGKGLAELVRLAQEYKVGIRSQSGLRIGTLVTDDDVLVWPPTPLAVESRRTWGEPNGIDLRAAAVSNSKLTDLIRDAVGADDSSVLPLAAEIGQAAATQLPKTGHSQIPYLAFEVMCREQ